MCKDKLQIRYESHPGVRLHDHLLEVAKGAQMRLDHPALKQRELLRDVAWLIGVSHDLGKYTSYFQEYLSSGKRYQDNLERHGFVGAVFASWLTIKKLPTLPEVRHKEFVPILAYTAVHRHHGHLQSPEALIPRSPELKNWPSIGIIVGEQRHALDAFKIQWDNLINQRSAILDDLPEIPEVAEFLSDKFCFYDLFHNLDKLLYRLSKNPDEDGALSEEEGAVLCLWEQLLFSALIDADKFSAAKLERTQRLPLNDDLVKRYLENLESASNKPQRKAIDRHRIAFQKKVRQRVERLTAQEIVGKIFSLTAPTGLGKTFAALDSALLIRKKLDKHFGIPPRIVYSLPFINIIEQNYDQFYNVMRCTLGETFKQSAENFLLRHHHLAEIEYHVNNENIPVEHALLLTESWESEIIVTTFVQLFQTIIGYKNRFLRKLHNLIGAIVILDEIQSLPMEYWPLTGKVFETLCREMGLVVIQMTATRPLIFQNAIEIYPDPQSLFIKQSRTKMYATTEERDFEDWCDEILDLYCKHESLLVVVNTVRMSLQIYEWLSAKGLGAPFELEVPDNKEWLVYISTNITPKQRRDRLNALKSLLENKGRALVISTQVIEAGVDIDFPAVVRDIGPLDSIVQVAGRCNREGQREKGYVYVLPIKDGGCSQVYGVIHRLVAQRLLTTSQQLDESEYSRIVENYFLEAKERLSQERSDELWKAYSRLRYDGLMQCEEANISDFHLIEGKDQVSIFVSLTDEDEEWFLKNFKSQVLTEKDMLKRNNAYLKYRTRLHEHMISPSIQRAILNLPPTVLGEKEGLRWIPYNQLGDYYDLKTGFKWQFGEKACVW
ncbi:CRISPR-associated helicase Cas3' [Acetomicrobium sp.]|uniref:CRISPR-associated helicase Cas3' n=1 Tax=Acetomicrobium sp. TaxID=1872099 RepID=UPI001BD06F2A|nr:CRISPR-associated helicase Cas3' [Acetomicrobium sp.]